MKHADRERLAQKLDEAKAKVALTIFNDAMPSARLISSVLLLNQVIDELRGMGHVGPADISEVHGVS